MLTPPPPPHTHKNTQDRPPARRPRTEDDTAASTGQQPLRRRQRRDDLQQQPGQQPQVAAEAAAGGAGGAGSHGQHAPPRGARGGGQRPRACLFDVSHRTVPLDKTRRLSAAEHELLVMRIVNAAVDEARDAGFDYVGVSMLFSVGCVQRLQPCQETSLNSHHTKTIAFLTLTNPPSHKPPGYGGRRPR